MKPSLSRAGILSALALVSLGWAEAEKHMGQVPGSNSIEFGMLVLAIALSAAALLYLKKGECVAGSDATFASVIQRIAIDQRNRLLVAQFQGKRYLLGVGPGPWTTIGVATLSCSLQPEPSEAGAKARGSAGAALGAKHAKC